MSQTLFQLNDEMRQLEAMLTELGGDISDADVEAFFDQWFASLTERLDHKVEGYCWLIAEFEGRAKGRKEQAERLAALATTDSNAAARLKKRLQFFMESSGKTELQTDSFKLKIANNGGKLPLWIAPEVEHEPALLPEQFHKHVVQVDKEELRRVVETGEAVTIERDGAPVEVARIQPRGTHLRIK